MKYKLYIRQYNITTNDYEVREEIVETNDIYHEIGKIYSTAFTEIRRIDYEKIDETKELKAEIERLNKQIEEYQKALDETTSEKIELANIIKEVREILQFHLSNPSGTKNGWHIDIWNDEDINKLNEHLEILDKVGSEKE